jgi:sugar phosphate isomerase/epimerase
MTYYVSVPLKRFEERIDFFSAGGFHPEIRMNDAAYLLGCSGAALERTRRLIEERSLTLFTHGPFFGLDCASIDAHIADYSRSCLERGLEVTAALGGSVMVIHTGYLPMFSRAGRRAWYRNWAARMPALAERAGRLGTTLALENTWEDRPEVIEHLLGAVPGAGVCLDTGHLNAFSRLSVARWWKVLGNRVVALHLHDNDGLSDDHQVPGTGTFDFGALMRLVKGSNPMPLMDFELEPAVAALGRRYIEELLA